MKNANTQETVWKTWAQRSITSKSAHAKLTGWKIAVSIRSIILLSILFRNKKTNIVRLYSNVIYGQNSLQRPFQWQWQWRWRWRWSERSVSLFLADIFMRWNWIRTPIQMKTQAHRHTQIHIDSPFFVDLFSWLRIFAMGDTMLKLYCKYLHIHLTNDNGTDYEDI